MIKKYPCRTEIVNGITYRVTAYRDGKWKMRTSFESKEKADRWASSMAKNSQYSFEIIEEPWTSEVCIECGKEAY